MEFSFSNNEIKNSLIPSWNFNTNKMFISQNIHILRNMKFISSTNQIQIMI